MTQLEFPPARRRPEPTPAEIALLLRALEGRGWVTGEKLLAELGLSERRLRACAEASSGRVLSGPGSPGYRLNDPSATKEEVLRTAGQHKSQAAHHERRSDEILRVFHAHGSSSFLSPSGATAQKSPSADPAPRG